MTDRYPSRNRAYDTSTLLAFAPNDALRKGASRLPISRFRCDSDSCEFQRPAGYSRAPRHPSSAERASLQSCDPQSRSARKSRRPSADHSLAAALTLLPPSPATPSPTRRSARTSGCCASLSRCGSSSCSGYCGPSPSWRASRPDGPTRPRALALFLRILLFLPVYMPIIYPCFVSARTHRRVAQASSIGASLLIGP